MSNIDRLPAIPLIASDPYLSIWMPADTLTQTDTCHWSGPAKPVRGTLTVDGHSARFLGAGPLPLCQRVRRRAAGSLLCHPRPAR